MPLWERIALLLWGVLSREGRGAMKATKATRRKSR